MITVQTNKVLYYTHNLSGLTEIRRTRVCDDDTPIPEGTEFEVLDIIIERDNENLGESKTAFYCENAEMDICDWIHLEDIADQC